MKREEFEKYISDNYAAENDYPWMTNPMFEVFRHRDNRKWFALIMDIPKSKLGVESEEIIDVVNLKCDTVLIGSLISEDGIFPAYHMNKDNWITVALDDSVSDETVKALTDMSFVLTKSRTKRRKQENADFE